MHLFSFRHALFFCCAVLLSACQSTPTLPTPTATATPAAPVAVQPTASATARAASPTAAPTATATERATATPPPTTAATRTARPSRTVTTTAEATIELSPVDATQVANATGTAVALIASATASASPSVTADASPTASATGTISATVSVTGTAAATPSLTPSSTVTVTPTAAGGAAPTPGALPTASDGRYPKAQEAGFTISIVANSADNPIIHPTSLAWDASGALYVSRQEGEIVRVAPDGTRTSFAQFSVPVGMAFRPGTSNLYVAHRGGITMVRDNTGDGVADTYQPLVSGMPCCYAELHQTNGLQFGGDGWLYFGQGANSDHGEVPAEEWHAGILRVHPDQGQGSMEYVATGVRNSYDLTIRRDGHIFATDNGADFGPPEELNHIIPGADYGWPHCYTDAQGGAALHPSHPDSSCEGTRTAIATFVPHASANGITVYEGIMFPAAYRGNLFVALWSHITDAYRIVRVQLTPAGDTFSARYTPFVTDFELPLDVAVGPDGALYVADWGPGRIYRIAYE